MKEYAQKKEIKEITSEEYNRMKNKLKKEESTR